MNLVLKAEGLVKRFGPLEALRGVSFEIRAGESVCVWGPSGAGKSTLLHLAGLMAAPTAGTLLENVMMPLLIRRRSRPEAEARARALLVRLGLSARAHHRPAEASGGEQQRAALARALAGEPGLVLADEPTGNLDRGVGREVEAMLREEVKARGAALVVVTHDEGLAAQADRRLVLVDGLLVEESAGG